MSIRRSLGVALLPVVAFASGCATTGTAGKPSLGYISGYAPPCVAAYISRQGLEAIKVRVQLVKGTRVVEVQTVTGSHIYHFAVSPGTYVVRSDQGGTAPSTVTVTKGQKLTANLRSICR